MLDASHPDNEDHQVCLECEEINDRREMLRQVCFLLQREHNKTIMENKHLRERNQYRRQLIKPVELCQKNP